MDKTITFIGLNYAPENTAIGLYSTQLVHFLRDKGCQINVVTAFPYYPQWQIPVNYNLKPTFLKEEEKGITIFRYKQYVPKHPSFIKRILHILDFTYGSWRNLSKIKKADVVISIVPFTSSAWLGNIHARKHKVKHWVHIQDFEFDAAFQSGLVGTKKQNGWMYKVLMKLESTLLNQANSVSTISHAMLSKLKAKTDTVSYYFPNWINGNSVNPAFAKAHPLLTSSKFKLLYAGNIGSKQDWTLFVDFVALLDPTVYEVVIVGDGAYKRQLKDRIKNQSHISVYDPVPYEALNDLLCSADVHLLFQKTEILDTVMPSKILGMMASAKPSIIVGHPASEVNQILTEAQGGSYLTENNPHKAFLALEELRSHPEKAATMGKEARKYVLANFSEEVILNSFYQKLKTL